MSFEIDAATSAEEIGIDALAEAVFWPAVGGTRFVLMMCVIIFGQSKFEDAVANLRWDLREEWAGGLWIISRREGI